MMSTTNIKELPFTAPDVFHTFIAPFITRDDMKQLRRCSKHICAVVDRLIPMEAYWDVSERFYRFISGKRRRYTGQMCYRLMDKPPVAYKYALKVLDVELLDVDNVISFAICYAHRSNQSFMCYLLPMLRNPTLTKTQKSVYLPGMSHLSLELFICMCTILKYTKEDLGDPSNLSQEGAQWVENNL